MCDVADQAQTGLAHASALPDGQHQGLDNMTLQSLRTIASERPCECRINQSQCSFLAVCHFEWAFEAVGRRPVIGLGDIDRVRSAPGTQELPSTVCDGLLTSLGPTTFSIMQELLYIVVCSL